LSRKIGYGPRRSILGSDSVNDSNERKGDIYNLSHQPVLCAHAMLESGCR
jgi:hypothetical protein